MANFVLQVPITLRSFTVSASSNPNGALSGSNSGVGPVILELPLDKIRRPLMRTRSNDPIKVQELMDSISQIGLQVPIDVLEVDGNYYGMCFNEFGRGIVSLAVTGMRLTNDLDSPPYAAKYGVVQKRL